MSYGKIWGRGELGDLMGWEKTGGFTDGGGARHSATT